MPGKDKYYVVTGNLPSGLTSKIIFFKSILYYIYDITF